MSATLFTYYNHYGKMCRFTILFLSIFLLLLPTIEAQGGYTLDFDGTDDYVSIPHDASLNPANITVEAWFNPRDIAGQSIPPIVKKANTTEGYAIEISNSNNELRFHVRTAGNWYNSPAYVVPSLDEWYHVVGTYDGNDIQLYVNGVYIGATNIVGSIAHSTDVLTIGYDQANAGRYWDGKIDEIRIWSDVRTQAEIQANMHRDLVGNEANLVAYYQMSDGSGTSLTDNSANSNTGTLTNSPIWKTSGAHAGPGMALDFDGSDDYVAGTVSAAATSTFTMEGWFSFNNLTSQQNLMDFRQTANINVRMIPYKTAANELALYVFDGSSPYVTTSSFTVPLTNVWHHMVFIYDAGTVSIYVDGVLVGSNTGQGSFISGTTNHFAIAADYNGSAATLFSNVKVDEVRLWNDVRTEAEIRANMHRTLGGDEANLLVYYRFDQQNDVSHTTLYDYSGNGNDGTLNDTDATLSWVSANPFNTWIGSEDSDWSNGDNWSRGSAPSTEDVGIYNWAGSNAPVSANITGRNLYIDASSTLSHSGNLTLSGNLYNEGSFTTSGTLTFSGSSAQTLEGSGSTTAGTLVVNNAAGLSIEHNVTTNTDLSLTNGALTIGANTLTINGSISRTSGTLIGGSTSSIVMGGSGSSTALPAVTLNNLTLNRANGISLSGALTVEGTLSLSNGDLTLNSQTLTIDESASISGASASRYIVATSGNLRKNFAAAASFNYPVGDGSSYTPLSLNFGSGTFSSAYADVNLTTGKHPNNSSSNHYINRYWTVSSSGISSFSCDVNATYAGGDVFGTESELVGGKWSGSWTNLGFVNAASNLISGTVSSFSDFTAGEPPAFPVEWLHFEALLENDFVRLNWSTATELNSDYFGVERSLDDETWQTLGKVQSVGQSASRQDYSFRDERIFSGKAQYRLRQVDLNGGIDYSNAIEIERNPLIRIYPNPITDILNLELPSQDWQAELYDSSGRLVKKVANIGDKLDLTVLTQGTYILRLIGPRGQRISQILEKR